MENQEVIGFVLSGVVKPTSTVDREDGGREGRREGRGRVKVRGGKWKNKSR